MINQRGGRIPSVYLLVRLGSSPLTIQDQSAVPRAAGRGSAARLREAQVLCPPTREASLVPDRPTVEMPETRLKHPLLWIRVGRAMPVQLFPRFLLPAELLHAGARVARRSPIVHHARIARPRGPRRVRLARAVVDYRLQLAVRAFLIQLVRASETKSLGRLAGTPHERGSYQRLVLEGATRYQRIPPRLVAVSSILPLPAPLLPKDRVLADQPVRETLAFAFHGDQAPFHYLETAQSVQQLLRLPAAVYL